MTRIGFLIPEFPGQTHAFFIRERQELKKLGLETELISTRTPVSGAGAANHEWAEAAAKETTYLFPLGKGELLMCLLNIIFSGPLAWFRCLGAIFGKSDLPLSQRPKLLAFVIAGAFLKRFCQRKGLAHVHVHSCANAANVAMFARLLNGPTYSLTLHGPMHDYGEHQAYKWKHAAFCIVITQELVDEVNTNLAHITLPPIYLAPMGVNVDDFKRSNIYQPVKQGEVIKLVSCGRLNIVKAHDDLIRVVASLKEKGIATKLNICGSTDSVSDKGGYTDELKALRKELNVEEEVDFLGSVSESQVKQELESAHFFCLASLKEPLGVATMEAMAMEIPAIVTRSPGVSEMVDSGVDGILVEPRSPEQFVETIIDLASDPEKSMELAAQGRKKVLARFHSGVSAGKIAQGVKALN